MRIVKGLAVLGIVLLCASSAMAAGFRLPEAGAKAMGMGFAFTAQADDPSAIYFNPAGLTQLNGQNIMAGLTYIDLKGGEFTGSSPLSPPGVPGETQKNLVRFIPNAYFTQKIAGDLYWGLGVFSPFGLAQEYNNKDASIFRNQISLIDLQTIVFNPTIAWKVNEAVSVGAGIDIMYGKAKLSKFAVSGAGTNLFNLFLTGDGTAWGYNFGVLVKPVKEMRLGFNYRSPFSLEIKDGEVTLTQNLTALPGYSRARTTVSMPATAALGAAYKFFDRLTVEADLDWTFWSSYSELNIQNQSTPALSSTPTGMRRNWKDVTAFRIGGEYRVTDPLALRLGFAYDPSPVPASTMSPDLPDADRLNYMAGVGYKYGNWTIDGSYYYLQRKERTVSNIRLEENGNPIGFSGTWKGSAHLVALDIGYRF